MKFLLSMIPILASTYGSGPYGQGVYNGSQTSSGGLVNTGSHFLILISLLAILMIVVVVWLWLKSRKDR